MTMKKICKQFLVGVILLSLVVPFVPQYGPSTVLTENEMLTIVGGAAAVDCAAIAASFEVFCIGFGGDWVTCRVVAAMTYLACLAAKLLGL